MPKGWEVGEVGDLITLQRGFDLPKKNRQDGPFPVMAAGGHHGTHNEFKVKEPGVTTGRSGVIGQVYLVTGDFWPLNTSLWIKEFKGCSPYFAYFFLGALDLAALNSGSAVPSLSWTCRSQSASLLHPYGFSETSLTLLSCAMAPTETSSHSSPRRSSPRRSGTSGQHAGIFYIVDRIKNINNVMYVIGGEA
ncbi:restriction endonuclease subunit S [Antarcticimicrobium luteum]|uniref:restriction endonuclease subunit S n=1 Tax=Antarcticimicrobium luteum TaxID=2547397 RepID=UPI003CCA77E1